MRSTGDSQGESGDRHGRGSGRDGDSAGAGQGPLGADGAAGLPEGPGFVGFLPAGASVASVDAAHDAVVAVRTLAALDVDGLSDDECLGVFDDLELVRRSLSAATGAVLVELESRGVCDARYGTSSGVWFERRHGRSRQSVGREARSAKRLRSSMPFLAAALGRGEITPERVELIVSKVNDRNVDALAGAQAALLALSAAESSFAQFSVLVADLARYADADGGHDPEPGRSRVSARRSGDELLLGGTLVGAQGASFEELVESATNRLWRRYRDDIKECPGLAMPSRTELRAEALLELVRRGASVEIGSAKRPVAELSLIAEPASGSGVLPIAEIWGGSTNAVGSATDDGSAPPADWSLSTPAGVPLELGTGEWELLCCNFHVSELQLDPSGRFVACRETDRGPSRAQRRALEARDGGCVFPGCDCPPAWCDAHHVHPHAQGGATVMCSMVLLCRHHHGVVHRKGWTLRPADPDDDPDFSDGPGGAKAGWFAITTARGLVMNTVHRRGAARHGPPPSARHGPSG